MKTRNYRKPEKRHRFYLKPWRGAASAGFWFAGFEVQLRVLSMRFAGFAGDDRSEPISYAQEL
jgi:hypothetical protein